MMITDQEQIAIILKTLADPIDSEIIRITSENAKPVSHIVSGTKVPSSSIYRRLRNLQDQGMIYQERHIDPTTDKPINRYRGSFQHIQILFDGKETIIEVVPTKKIIEQTYSLFSRFKK